MAVVHTRRNPPRVARICQEEIIMTALTHWNPFKGMARYEPVASFDDLFRGLGLGTRPSWADLAATPDIRIDVSEDDKAFHVKAEMPGVEKKDIDISVDGNQISIGAEVKRESKKKDGETDIYTERYAGKVYRAFTLPKDVDEAKADAQYDKGVLMLTLPKKANGNGRRIAVA
jgi:HSP20 family protein